MKKVVVIGSGFGGLASAIRLRTSGYDVELFEARDKPGGRAYVYEQDGFTFDAGPTVITAPFLLDEIFEGAGRRTADYVKIVPVDPFYRIEFHDGRSFEYNGDEEQTERRVAAFAPGDLDGYRQMIRAARSIFQKGFVELADRPFLRFSDMIRIAPDLMKLQSYRTVYGFVSRYVKDPLLRRVFSFHPLLVGGNPFQTTSIYALIHHLERQWGVHYAMGGTGAIVRGMTRLFEEMGGRIRLSSPVSRIVLAPYNGRPRAAGIQLAGGELVGADAVVSNADIANTYRKMIAPEFRKRNTDRKLERMRYSMSLFVIYFGTPETVPRRAPPHDHSQRALQGVARRHLQSQIIGRRFLVYLHRPTATDPAMAPAGCDCFYALIPVPNLLGGLDWSREAKPFRDRVMKFLDATYLPGLLENLATERVFTPSISRRH